MQKELLIKLLNKFILLLYNVNEANKIILSQKKIPLLRDFFLIFKEFLSNNANDKLHSI